MQNHSATYSNHTGSDSEGEDFIVSSPNGYPLELLQYAYANTPSITHTITQISANERHITLTLSPSRWLELWVNFANHLWDLFHAEKFLTVTLNCLGFPVLLDHNTERKYNAFTLECSDLEAIQSGFFPTIFSLKDKQLWLHYAGLAKLSPTH